MEALNALIQLHSQEMFSHDKYFSNLMLRKYFDTELSIVTN